MSIDRTAGREATRRRVAPRKRPVQQRSRERVERLLDVARDLIRERGYANLNVRELAEIAEVNIATVYQYFPNARAILRALAESDLAKMEAAFAAEVERLIGSDDIEKVAAALTDFVFDFYVREPAQAYIARGMQSDNELLRLDLEDTGRAAARVYEVIRRGRPQAGEARARTAALMLSTMVPAGLRLALLLDTRARAAMRREIKAMVGAYLATLD